MFSLFHANHDRQDHVAGVGPRRMSASYGPDEYVDQTYLGTQRLASLSGVDDTVTDVTVTERSIQVDATVGNLARQLSSCLAQPPCPGAEKEDDLFNPKQDSDLDPYSANFSSKAWARKIVDIASRDANKTLRKAGIAYRNLSVHGFGSDTDFQATVSNVFISGIGKLKDALSSKKKGKIQILSGFDGLVESGEMLIVLGPPGSGCSTLLKTVAGEMDGLYLDEDSCINYRGITQKQMTTKFRGEAIYSAEQDVHFPQLTVGETLTFAAEARAPRHPPGGLTRKQFAHHLRDVAMAVCGISHTVNTRVGNDFVRGVSGGERKRVSIAEALLSGAPLQSWDNSTRGLDSANAIEFCRTLRLTTELGGSAAVVAIYQAPQSAYDVFDKVCVLYAGEQIFFGPTDTAKQFFVDMGFHCPEQSTTPDFLTSLTSPAERRARPGFEKLVPKTPKEFVARWKSSENYAQLQMDLEEYESRYGVKGEHYQEFLAARRAQQSKKVRPASPYTISFGAQVELCLRRGFQRLRADPSLTLSQLFGNFIVGLIVSSVFFNMQPTTSTFYSRGSLIFFSILLNALASALEILTLYAQRPIVEKHKRYAFVHASAEAVASMLVDLPYKVTNSICFNAVIYFMANLRREPGPFFFFLLIGFTATLTMSMLFRFIASISRTLSQALAPAAILILLLLAYAGFAIATPNMLSWIKWFRYLDPVYYAFESLMINEFHNRDFACSNFVPNGPTYMNVEPLQHVCSTIGAVPGSSTVNGDVYLGLAYQYFYNHKWRNFGILIVFMVGLCSIYLIAAELVSGKKSKGEVLVFPRSKLHAVLKETSGRPDDSEAPSADRITTPEKLSARGERKANAEVAVIERQTSIFHWQDVCYDIKIKGEPRRILDHVDGWVKPGTLTALMGVSGAGKTTLLDVLATRVTMGVITGEMLVDGRPRDVSFARKTGYCQQQDLHLETSTVREALQFSAILRQPSHIPRNEKVRYVEEIIQLLEMDTYADAVVGVPGVGLNVEQRKRLTIAVELVAKPELLLFLDEPTSGLDSQTSWSILDLLDKLRHHGQAILCTIHQPSAILFERFDRLLFLAKGGRTIYFGEVGQQSSILASYFERNGSPKFPATANPAEFMLEVIGAAPGTHTDIDWHKVWLESPERAAVRGELSRLKGELPQSSQGHGDKQADGGGYREFSASFAVQLTEVTKRVWQQYWRTPTYIWSKALLCLGCTLLVGFSFFKAKNSLGGLQNQVFSVFLIFVIFGSLCQQIMPLFVTQRALYEVRERPSRTYSWKVFMFSNIAVEIPWTTLMALLMFLCWYYPVGFYRNAEPTEAVHERGALFFLFLWQFMLFTSSFAFAAIAGVSTAETAGNIANLLFVVVVIFCGVLATPQQFPGFWVFMYRVSPFTYFVQGFTGVGISGTNVVCAPQEFITFDPPSGETCQSYAQTFIETSGGYLANPNATTACDFCTFSSTTNYLAQYDIHYDQRWRNFGLLWSYILFNIVAALFFYWLARVPKKFSRKIKKE